MIPEELVILTKLSVQLNLKIGPRIESILLQYLEEDQISMDEVFKVYASLNLHIRD